MKKTFIPLICIIAAFSFIFSSCVESQDDSVMLANNMTLKLAPGEKIVENTGEIVNFHDSIFNSYGALNWPLYKAIEGKNYSAFVGVPIETNKSQLIEVIEKDDSNRNIEKIEGDSTSFLHYKKGDLYIVSVIADYNDFLWTLSASSEDSSQVSFLFDQSEFSNRVSKNE